MNQLRESAFAKHLTQFMLVFFMVAGTSIGISGCEQDSAAENIGESIDEGVEETQDEFDDHT